MFFEYATKDPYFFFSWIIIITFSICVHEFAHAQVALWKGDDTAARQGHLSLNPLVQMGWSSLIMLVLLGIAWGAVPVNVYNMRGKSAPAQVAFAGPMANLLLCGFFALLGAMADTLSLAQEIEHFMMMASMANALLFLFNMLPIPMFDGWTVLSLFVEPMRRVDIRKASNISWMLLIVIWTTGVMDGIWQVGARMSAEVKGIAGSTLQLIGL